MPGTKPLDPSPPVYFLHIKTNPINRNAVLAAADDNGVSTSDVVNDLIKRGLSRYVDKLTPPPIGDFSEPVADPDVDPDTE